MPRRPQLISREKRAEVPPAPPHEFGVATVPEYLRQFPAEFTGTRPVKFFPAQPERIVGDVLEIGPGRGDFVFAEAKDHPDQQFVVVELGKKRYAKLVERLQKRGLTNVLVVFGDARVVLPKYFDDATFSSVVVLFPDPWPKRKHAFNRLLQPVFLTELARLLKPGGHLYLKSDVESYVQWVREQVSQLPQYRIVEDRWPWSSVDGQDGKTLSLFADRQLGFGYGIHSLCLERV